MLIERSMRIENVFDALLQMRMRFIKPISTKDNEQRKLIACIAPTRLVAFGSMEERHCQIAETTKCQIPNAIVTMPAASQKYEQTLFTSYLRERVVAARYASVGTLLCLAFLVPEEPTVNLVIAVHFPLRLPVIVAVKQ
jgi:hypothetical protein